jgi:beta-phosphoglucomutase-like phosphatase (HAD superfamily)
LLERRGATPAYDFFAALAGNTEPEIWSLLTREFGLCDRAETLRHERLAELLALFSEAGPPNWFVQPALEHFERTGTQSVIISSGYTEVVLPYLDRWDLTDRFASVSTGGLVAGPPAIAKAKRLEAALASAVAPAILFEDSAPYLALARTWGVLVIGVRHAINVSTNLDADAVLEAVTS